MSTNTSSTTRNPSTDAPIADTKGASSNISPKPSTDIKPRSEWDEDEIFDGRPKPATISVLVVSPYQAPYAHELDNNLDAMQALIGGTVTSFDCGVFDTVGIAHDEGLLIRLPPNRLIPATGAVIFGTFFIAGSGINLHSLTPRANDRSRPHLRAPDHPATARPTAPTRTRRVRRLSAPSNAARPNSIASWALFICANGSSCRPRVFPLSS